MKFPARLLRRLIVDDGFLTVTLLAWCLIAGLTLRGLGDYMHIHTASTVFGCGCIFVLVILTLRSGIKRR